MGIFSVPKAGKPAPKRPRKGKGSEDLQDPISRVPDDTASPRPIAQPQQQQGAHKDKGPDLQVPVAADHPEYGLHILAAAAAYVQASDPPEEKPAKTQRITLRLPPRKESIPDEPTTAPPETLARGKQKVQISSPPDNPPHLVLENGNNRRRKTNKWRIDGVHTWEEPLPVDERRPTSLWDRHTIGAAGPPAWYINPAGGELPNPGLSKPTPDDLAREAKWVEKLHKYDYYKEVLGGEESESESESAVLEKGAKRTGKPSLKSGLSEEQGAEASSAKSSSANLSSAKSSSSKPSSKKSSRKKSSGKKSSAKKASTTKASTKKAEEEEWECCPGGCPTCTRIALRMADDANEKSGQGH